MRQRVDAFGPHAVVVGDENAMYQLDPLALACDEENSKYSSTVATSGEPAPVKNAAGRRHARPDDAEQQARGEAADAERGVVDSERGAARARRARDRRPRPSPLLRSTRSRGRSSGTMTITTDGDVEHSRTPAYTTGIHEPAERRSASAGRSDPTARRRRPTRSTLTTWSRGPEKRNPERGDAEIADAQEQERVAGVAEAEDEDDRDAPGTNAGNADECSEAASRLRAITSVPSGLTNRASPQVRGACLWHAQQDQHDDDAGDDRSGQRACGMRPDRRTERPTPMSGPTTAPA